MNGPEILIVSLLLQCTQCNKKAVISILTVFFKGSNKARATPKSVSFKGLIQIFWRVSLTFSHGSTQKRFISIIYLLSRYPAKANDFTVNETIQIILPCGTVYMLPEVVLTFTSADEPLGCNCSNESYWAFLTCSAVYYAAQGYSNFQVCTWTLDFIWYTGQGSSNFQVCDPSNKESESHRSIPYSTISMLSSLETMPLVWMNNNIS